MASVAINTSSNVNIDFELAGVDKRLPAWLVDLFIRYMYIYIISKFISFRNTSDTMEMMIGLAAYLPILFYYLIFEIIMNGQTPGKFIFKIKVVSLEGYKPNYIQYLNRWVFRLLDTGFITLIFFGLFADWKYALVFAAANIGSVIFFLNSKKEQRIGDLAANTVVIRLSKKTRIEDTIFTEINEQNYTVTYPQVTMLSDRDVSIIKDALRAAEKSRKYYMLDNITNKLVTALKTEYPHDPYDYLQKIISDFNYLTTR